MAALQVNKPDAAANTERGERRRRRAAEPPDPKAAIWAWTVAVWVTPALVTAWFREEQLNHGLACSAGEH